MESQDRIAQLLKERGEKLEKIKDVISPKTYHLISEKIQSEMDYYSKYLNQRQGEILQENAPQSLPKNFFELSHLKPKTIRID